MSILYLESSMKSQRLAGLTTEKLPFLHLKKRLRRDKWGEILTANKGDKMSLFIYLYSASFLKSFEEGIFHKKHIQTDSLKINKGSYIQIGKECEEAIYVKQIISSKRMCRKTSNLVNRQGNTKLNRKKFQLTSSAHTWVITITPYNS